MILNKFNFYLMLFLSILFLIAAFVAPILLNHTNGYYWYLGLLLLLPGLLFTNTTWVLIHEGVHNNLNSNPKKNLIYSRCLSIFMHSNFEVLKFCHLMHHRFNRTDYDLTEGYDQNIIKTKNKFVASCYKLLYIFLYYIHITLGLYIAEIVGPLLLLLPVPIVVKLFEKISGSEHAYVINGKKILLRSSRVRNIRIDNILNIILFLIIIVLYGDYLWIYLIYLLAKAWLISSVDNLPHYNAGLDNVTGAFNLRAAKIWQKMLLNFNYHRVHHKYPYLAWHLLPGKFTADNDYFNGNYFIQYLKQWRGIISKEKLKR